MSLSTECFRSINYLLDSLVILPWLSVLLGVQHDMLRDESSCDGRSIVEKLESFVQGTVYMVEHNSAHCCKLCYSSKCNFTIMFIYNYMQIVTRICWNNWIKMHLECMLLWWRTLLSHIGASKNAEGLFQDVLGRKDDADRTRNALNVLQRFRFLFSLPQCIEKNIQQVFWVKLMLCTMLHN